jgi:hypothetical protein
VQAEAEPVEAAAALLPKYLFNFHKSVPAMQSAFKRTGVLTRLNGFCLPAGEFIHLLPTGGSDVISRKRWIT